jgi:hypothetical protein
MAQVTGENIPSGLSIDSVEVVDDKLVIRGIRAEGEFADWLRKQPDIEDAIRRALKAGVKAMSGSYGAGKKPGKA